MSIKWEVNFICTISIIEPGLRSLRYLACVEDLDYRSIDFIILVNILMKTHSSLETKSIEIRA